MYIHERERSTTTATPSPTNDQKQMYGTNSAAQKKKVLVEAMLAQKRLVGLRVAVLTQISCIYIYIYIHSDKGKEGRSIEMVKKRRRGSK
jgi:hypothetical protein